MIGSLFAGLLSLAKNAVPAVGVLLREWSVANAMLLYLGENVVLVLLSALAVRIVGPKGSTGKSLQTFFLVAVPFTFGAAVFTIFVIAIRDEYTVNVRELGAGFATMLAFQVIGFAVNLRQLRGVTIAECEEMLVGVLGRVFLLAMAVWIGLLLAFAFSSAFLIPFMILKTIVDLGSLRPAALKQRLMRGV